MTDRELIKALRYCADGDCCDCPWHGSMECHREVNSRNSANRIEALLAENERLKTGKDTNVPTKRLSVAGHIRAMSDFELMEFLWKLDSHDLGEVIKFCGKSHVCDELDVDEITEGMCQRCLLAKLQQPRESSVGEEK